MNKYSSLAGIPGTSRMMISLHSDERWSVGSSPSGTLELGWEHDILLARG